MRESGRYLLVGREGARAAGAGAGGMALRADGALGADGVQPGGAARSPSAYSVPISMTPRWGEGRAAEASRAIGAFAGPAFNPDDIAGHLAAFPIGRRKA